MLDRLQEKQLEKPKLIDQKEKILQGKKQLSQKHFNRNILLQNQCQYSEGQLQVVPFFHPENLSFNDQELEGKIVIAFSASMFGKLNSHEQLIKSLVIFVAASLMTCRQFDFSQGFCRLTSSRQRINNEVNRAFDNFCKILIKHLIEGKKIKPKKIWVSFKLLKEQNQLISSQIQISLKLGSIDSKQTFEANWHKSYLSSIFQITKENNNQPATIKLSLSQYILQKLVFPIAFLHKQLLCLQQKKKNLTFLETNYQLISQIIANQGFVCLQEYWNGQLRENLESIVSNFQVYDPKYREELKNLTKIIMYQSFQHRLLFENIWKGMNRIVTALASKLQIPHIHQIFEIYKQTDKAEEAQVQFLKQFRLVNNLKLEAITVNILLINIAEEAIRNIKNGDKIVFNVKYQGDRIPLRQYVSKHFEFITGTSVWQDIFSTIWYENKPQRQKQSPQSRRFLSNLNQKSLKQCKGVPSFSCLGCATSFYQRINIRDDSINKIPFLLLPSIKQIEEEKAEDLRQLVRAIIALLNSGGGVVLFDCEAIYLSIFPKGCQLKEKSKIKIKAKIVKLLKTIQSLPQPVNVEDLIRIDFVPIKDHPPLELLYINGEDKIFYDSSSTKRYYIPGQFITRLTVCPLNSTLLFFLKSGPNYCQFYIRQNSQVKLLGLSSIRGLIKKRVKDYYISEVEKKYKYLSNKPQNYFGHQCKSVDIGWPVRDDNKTNEIQRMRKEKSYRSMSLIVAKEQNLGQIKSRLIDEEVNCSIELKFKNFNFKSARHTAALFHDLQHSQLLKKANNIEVDSHILLALNITKFLKMQNRNQLQPPSKEQIQSVAKWLFNEFPNERLKVFEYRTIMNKVPVKQFYLKTDTRTASLFLYYFLTSYTQKVSFKQPTGLENIEELIKKGKWKQIFSLESQSE